MVRDKLDSPRQRKPDDAHCHPEPQWEGGVEI